MANSRRPVVETPDISIIAGKRRCQQGESMDYHFSESLGEKLRTYKVSLVLQVTKLIFGLFFGFAGLAIMAGTGLWRDEGWPSPVLGMALQLLAVLLFFALVYWFILAPVVRIILYPRIDIFEQGICYRTHFNRQCWPWQEFTNLSMTFTFSIQYDLIRLGEHRLYVDDQKVLGITYNYTHMNDLITDITDKMLKVLGPAYWESYQRDGFVEFGKIRFTHEGLTHGNTEVPFDEIRKFTVFEGQLRITRQGMRVFPTVIPLTNVPNWHVLLYMLDVVRRRRAAQAERTG